MLVLFNVHAITYTCTTSHNAHLCVLCTVAIKWFAVIVVGLMLAVGNSNNTYVNNTSTLSAVLICTLVELALLEEAKPTKPAPQRSQPAKVVPDR